MATNNSINNPVPTPIVGGGTGVTSVTTAPTASAWAGWDANSNFSANNFIPGYTTTATAAGTTTLTVGSTSSQFFTGSTTQTVTLPVTSTLTLGHHFYIVNNSSGAVTINSSGGNAIQVMAANTTCNVTCILTSGTSAASWYAEYAFQSGSSSGTVNSGTIGQLAYYAANGIAVSGGQLGNVAGTSTNDNAAAGNVGEFVTSHVNESSGVSMTNNVATDITSISLTAGDWDVFGNVSMINNGSQLAQYGQCWASLTSATKPDNSLTAAMYGPTTTLQWVYLAIPPLRVSIASTTTVYLSGQMGSNGTITGSGTISARRVR